MKKTNKLVQGIGTRGMEYPSYINYEVLKEYNAWKRMLERCTDSYPIKNPAYRGCSPSENFKSYTFFYEWCNKQIGFRRIDENGRSWQLDKDLLVKGNKIYSEDTCVFVPQRINKLLGKSDKRRGEYPVGVCWAKDRNRFRAECNYNNKTQKQLGSYDTVEEAFLAYKTFKEALIKQVANEYKDQLDPRAYEALVAYTVEITD